MILKPFRYAIHDTLTLRNDKNLDLSSFYCIGILGSIGSGKSMLIKLLADDRLHSAGAFSETPFCAYLSQDLTRLFTGNTVGSILKLYRDKRHIVGQHFDMETFTNVCEELKIGELVAADRRLTHYSEGERQRFGICLALAVKSPVCILDEPTTALNRHYREIFFRLIKQRKTKSRVFIISHRPLDHLSCCDAYILMENCELKAFSSADKMFDNELIMNYFSRSERGSHV